VETGATAGVRVLRSKFAGESGSRASMLIVRQLSVAIVAILVRCTRVIGEQDDCSACRRCVVEFGCCEVTVGVVGVTLSTFPTPKMPRLAAAQTQAAGTEHFLDDSTDV
jgi:hypothetical protein